jgi:hypothetical protein
MLKSKSLIVIANIKIGLISNIVIIGQQEANNAYNSNDKKRKKKEVITKILRLFKEVFISK